MSLLRVISLLLRDISRLLRDISLHLQIIPLHHRNISRLLGIHLQRQIGHVLVQLHLTPTQHPNRVRQEQVVIAVAGMNVYPSPHNDSATLINPHELANDDLTLHRKVRPNLPHTQHTSQTKMLFELYLANRIAGNCTYSCDLSVWMSQQKAGSRTKGMKPSRA